MAQEFVLPLALAWARPPGPHAPLAGDPALRAWVMAGLTFAARAVRRDGGGDDFFPGESALGACAFALYAGLRAADVIELKDAEIEAYFRRRGTFVARRIESGRLSNHEALVAACCLLLAERTGDALFKDAFAMRLDRLLSWQSEEGWFPEYDGCDLGYLTLTLGLMAEIAAIRPDPRIDAAIDAALPLIDAFLQPDGVLGGELNIRNTYNYFPHALEWIGARNPLALAINDRFIAALAAGMAAAPSDDQIIGHHLWSQLLAARDFQPVRPPPAPPPADVYLPQAGLMAVRRGAAALYAAPGKGGVARLFRDGELVAVFGQIALIDAAGRDASAAQPASAVHAADHAGGFVTEGRFGWSKRALNSPLRMIALRVLGLTIGRVAPDLLRCLLQALLITGVKPARAQFRRVVRWIAEDRLEVVDEWRIAAPARFERGVLSALIAPRAVVQSRVWHPAQRLGAVEPVALEGQGVITRRRVG